MSTRTYAPKMAAPKSSFAPMQGRLLQRKCACGRPIGLDAECAECSRKRLAGQNRSATEAERVTAPLSANVMPSSPDRLLERASYASTQVPSGHDFSEVQVYPRQGRLQQKPDTLAHQPGNNTNDRTNIMMSSPLGCSKCSTMEESGTDKRDLAELPLPEHNIAPDIDLAQEPVPVSPPPAPIVDVGEKAKSCCGVDSFTKSDDSYVDTPTDTRKHIKFTFKVKSGSDPRKCAMVNWIQGTAKNKDGTFRKVRMFDKTIDYNLPAMRIDSLDKDPIYWSTSSARWNYVSSGADSYYATDSPGPKVWVDGIDYDLKFKMCLHCIDDVSATSDESGSGVKNPLKCIDWTFKAKYDAAAKKFTQ